MKYSEIDDKIDFKDLKKRDRLDKKVLTKQLKKYRLWKKEIDRTPDREPVLKVNPRSRDDSGVFRYVSSYINYPNLGERLFKDRNKTLKNNFVEYVTQLFSILIESEFDEHEVVEMDLTGTEVYSINLKSISRNYSEFNEVLFNEGLLGLIRPHDTNKGRCREYEFPREILRKGVDKEFLSPEDKSRLVESIKINDGPDTTELCPGPVLRYYLDTLKRTTIDQKEFDKLEIELGRFRKLYPMVIRHRQGKCDLKLGKKEGRLYSVYLYSPKEFRRLIRLDGKCPLVEGDVGGSHFHFLLSEMTDPKEREMMMKDLLSPDPYLSMCGVTDKKLRPELKQSSHQFKYGNRKLNPKVFRDSTNPVSLVYRLGLFYRHLKKKYPVFCDSMSRKKFTHKKHRSDFACEIMRRESEVMVQKVGERCLKEKLVYLPIHDGFLTLPDQYDRVCEIITETFQSEVGSVPRIKRKG